MKIIKIFKRCYGMKALVIYGSRYGTSAEIAAEITKNLIEEGMDTHLID